MKQTRHLQISGHVQGVFFRESMRREAERLGIVGWVRNRRNGSVEAMVQGEMPALDAIIEWSNHGPPMARVDKVEIDSGSGSYAEFECRDTA